MATITQTKLVGFGYGNKSNYSATTYANHIWFDPTNKQILLNGIEYIPKKLSELVNDKNFLTSITKSMVESVLTGNITSHTHSYLPLSGGTLTGSLTAPNIYITGTTSILPSHYYHYLYQDSTDVYEHFGYGGINKITYGNFRFFDGNGSYKTLRIGGDGTFVWNGTNVSLEGHTHTFASITSKPTSLEGYGFTDAMHFYTIDNEKYVAARFVNPSLASEAASTYIEFWGKSGWYNFATGNLTCNGSYINMNGDSGAKGYKGYFNQSGTSNRASGSHIFMNYGQALGSNAISLGYNAFAGIRNQDADKTTYPYIAWQWMPTEKIHITINNQDTANGEFYGYEVLGGKMVQYELGGNTYTYENTSTYVRVLVCVKDDADTGLIFGGKSYMPFNATKTLIEGKYILGRGESITAVNTITVGEVNYYVLAIYTWSATVGYDYSTQVKVMCATKVNNSNYSGASSYASGFASVASGNSSVASGSESVASGAHSVASGNSSVASGAYSVASGYSSVASGNFSVASGNFSVASGYYSVASGAYSVASHNFSVVLARNGETMSSYQTIIGRYNAKVSGLFIIGNGSSSARSNALVVDESGNVTAKYFSGYANAVGSEGIKVYANNSNEINFGGISSSAEIYFGYRSLDSRPTPTTYNFGKGTATIQAASFSGNAATATKSEYSRNLLGRNTSGSDYPAISGNLVFAEWNTMSDNRWYLKANGYECRVAYATSASKLGTSNVGSATQPIYLNGGTPVACTYTLGKSVPSNAVFTDTTYSVATASADGLMSSDMFKAQMVKSVGVRQGSADVIVGGSITNHSVYITQKKSNITNAYQQAIGENDVTIPNATKDYDGSMSYTDKKKLDKMPPTVFGAEIVFYNNEILIDGVFGDYDIENDATVDGYDTIQENNHYITMVAFNITNTDLKDKLHNGLVKFGYSSKDNATYQTMRLLQSNFDGATLFVEFIHANPIVNTNFWFDCIWEVYPF